MAHHLSEVEHIDQSMHDCITACSDCHDICLATAHHCLSLGGEHAAQEHIRVLLDCAQACDVSRDFMLRGSPMHETYCRACAEICELCAESCERMADDDAVMRKCVEECRRCADSCRSMAGVA